MNFFAQATDMLSASPFAQVGLGGALLFIIVRWLTRVETIFTTRLDNVEHAMRGLSKAIWMDLAERAAAGSFVREEAKRMLKRMDQREEREAEEKRARK